MWESDEQCIAQCLNGQPDEFRQLVTRYDKPILVFLLGRMHDRDAAEEVAQEAFVRAYFRLGTLKKGSAFLPWLTSIARRVMLETFRRGRRAHQLDEASPPSVDRDNQRAEADDELIQAVARLPDIYREVTVLRYFGGLSCKEVATQLGIPLGTVTKRLSRAYGLLRESLSPDFEQEGVRQ
jgi:RNA polymerase sigma-70 factor (ECF subfamily)